MHQYVVLIPLLIMHFIIRCWAMTFFDEDLVFHAMTRAKLYAGVEPHKNCGAFVFVLPFCLLFCSKKVKDKEV